jgi:signal transduction histidine kinase
MTGEAGENGAYPTIAVGPAPFRRGPSRVILLLMDAGATAVRGPVLAAPAVLSRALVLLVLAAYIGVVYLALPVGLGALAGSGPDTALSVAATAIVALTFERVRSRTQQLVQRLVYGDRASPYEVLAELSDRVARDTTSPDVLGHMARIVAEGSGFESSRVWLRLADSLTVAAAWPYEPSSALPPVPIDGDELPSLPDAQLALPVRHRGELIGAITVRQSPGVPFSPADLRLLRDIAAQAGLVLRNVRLSAELAVRLEEISAQSAEIRASRERIVATQDAERRRVERDIHDGAQQYLVALMVRLRVARTLVHRDPERARVVAGDVRRILAEALGTLNDLAQGIHPPVLTSHGLAAALRRQEANPSVRVTVEDEGLGRYAAEVEAAVYFACLEALNNAAKHAAGANVTVRLTEDGGHLVFSVSDDGSGFDPAQHPPGSGLGNMTDRVVALGGSLDVHSAPSRGTAVRGRVPLAAADPGAAA